VCTNIVQLSGAVGSWAGSINGFYEPIDELVGNASVYKKLGDGVDVWIEYYALRGRWFLRPTASRGTGSGYAYATISPPRALEDCPMSSWEVTDGSIWVRQASFSVAVSSKASFEAAQVVIYSYIYIYRFKIHVLNAFVYIYTCGSAALVYV
jgi:hypothetical protein